MTRVLEQCVLNRSGCVRTERNPPSVVFVEWRRDVSRVAPGRRHMSAFIAHALQFLHQERAKTPSSKRFRDFHVDVAIWPVVNVWTTGQSVKTVSLRH